MSTDEAKITTGYNRRVWVTRKPDEAFLEECLTARFRIYAGVMIWAAIWYGGWTPLIGLDMTGSDGKKGGFTAQLYIDQILEPVLAPAWNGFKVSLHTYSLSADSLRRARLIPTSLRMVPRSMMQ